MADNEAIMKKLEEQDSLIRRLTMELNRLTKGNLFRDDPKKIDDNDMEQQLLYMASSTLVFEGCTFFILHASLELLNP